MLDKDEICVLLVTSLTVILRYVSMNYFVYTRIQQSLS